MKKKPYVKLVGENGNMFGIIGKVVKALRNAGMKKEAKAFKKNAGLIAGAKADEIVSLAKEYCEVEC